MLPSSSSRLDEHDGVVRLIEDDQIRRASPTALSIWLPGSQ
jgi:hypothetical protein